MEELPKDLRRRIEHIQRTIFECELPEKQDVESENYEVDTLEKYNQLQVIFCDCQWLTAQIEHLPKRVIETIVLDFILLCSQFTNPESSWNDASSLKVAIDGIQVCVHLSKCNNLDELLTGKSEEGSSKLCGMVPKLLLRLSQRFDKNNWKKYPGLLVTYLWLLKQLTEPHVGEHMGYLMPPALFLFDDWEEKNKILGISALDHILKEVAASQLHWYGRADVIYDALRKNQMTREPNLLKHLYPVLIKSARVVDGTVIKSMAITRLESVLQYLLSEMVFEQRLDRRHVYASALYQLMDEIGLLAVRWHETLLEVFERFLSSPDGINGQDILLVLKSMSTFIRNCQHRMTPYVGKFLEIMVTSIYKFKSDEGLVDQENTRNIYNEWKEIVLQLRNINGKEVEKFSSLYLQKVSELSLSEDVAKDVKQIMESNT